MTTARDMIDEGRLSGTLYVEQLAGAFDADRMETPGYFPPARRFDLTSQMGGEVPVAMAAE